jgi:cytochrome c oxidase subunit II
MDAQSVLNAAGPQAARIGGLWWVFLAVSVVVWLGVLVALAAAIVRRRARPGPPVVEPPGHGADPATRVPIAAPDPAGDARMRRVVSGLVAATAVVLVVLLVVSTRAGHAMSALSHQAPLTVEVIGHQWWWEVKYLAHPPAAMAITANELHLPVGTPVRIQLNSRDVIHSLWIPSLHGKKDLVPGHENELTLQVDRPGAFRGQCAEFCGLQHAKMALWVIAEAPEAFQAWLDAQRQPAPEPASEEARRGRDVFLRGACVMCHRVAGTHAGATVGPDLTHLASRRTIGAGALPNTRGHLAGWIVDAQGVKPGSRMPAMALESQDLQDLLTWLETLR